MKNHKRQTTPEKEFSVAFIFPQTRNLKPKKQLEIQLSLMAFKNNKCNNKSTRMKQIKFKCLHKIT